METSAPAGVSVVIPHYGSPGPALAVVRQLLDQPTAGPLEIIVADDCSPEPFPETPGVTVVRRETNGGFGTNVNTGAALAHHELLLVLNSDLELPDRFVDTLVAAATPWMPAVVSPYVVSADGRTMSAGRRFPTIRQQVVEWLVPLARWRPRLLDAIGHDTRARPGTDTVVDWVYGAALLLPTAELRRVGGFDERFYMNAEEVDLQRRLGLPSVVLGGVTVVHEGGVSTDPARARAWLVDARLTYADKWGGRRRLVAALRAATVVNLVWNTGRRLTGRPVAPWKTARAEFALLNQKDRR
jgi:GT2 family glycosyltransferase